MPKVAVSMNSSTTFSFARKNRPLFRPHGKNKTLRTERGHVSLLLPGKHAVPFKSECPLRLVGAGETKE